MPALAARYRVVRYDTPRPRQSPVPPGPVRHRRSRRRPAGLLDDLGVAARAPGRAVAGRHDGDATGRPRTRRGSIGWPAVHVGAARPGADVGGPRGHGARRRARPRSPTRSSGAGSLPASWRRDPDTVACCRHDRGDPGEGYAACCGVSSDGPAARPGRDHRADPGHRRRPGPGDTTAEHLEAIADGVAGSALLVVDARPTWPASNRPPPSTPRSGPPDGRRRRRERTTERRA